MTITIDPNTTAGVAVDAQKGFMPGQGPGFNELAAPQGDEIAEPAAAVAKLTRIYAASADLHTPDHASFVEQGGIWPVHCVKGTPGAALHPLVAKVVTPGWLFGKGITRDTDAYSAFDGINDDGRKLEEMLREEGIDTIVVVGLVTNVCVIATVLDALKAGLRVIVVLEGVRGIPGGDGLPTPEQAVEQMRDAGAIIVEKVAGLRATVEA